jgi:hypothetical protein
MLEACFSPGIDVFQNPDRQKTEKRRSSTAVKETSWSFKLGDFFFVDTETDYIQEESTDVGHTLCMVVYLSGAHYTISCLHDNKIWYYDGMHERGQCVQKDNLIDKEMTKNIQLLVYVRTRPSAVQFFEQIGLTYLPHDRSTHLYVANSKVAGVGCFADLCHASGDFVGNFFGERSQKDPEGSDCGCGSGYVLKVAVLGFISTKFSGNETMFMNYDRDPNVEFKIERDKNDRWLVNVYAMKNISSGDELFINMDVDATHLEIMGVMPARSRPLGLPLRAPLTTSTSMHDAALLSELVVFKQNQKAAIITKSKASSSSSSCKKRETPSSYKNKKNGKTDRNGHTSGDALTTSNDSSLCKDMHFPEARPPDMIECAAGDDEIPIRIFNCEFGDRILWNLTIDDGHLPRAVALVIGDHAVMIKFLQWLLESAVAAECFVLFLLLPHSISTDTQRRKYVQSILEFLCVRGQGWKCIKMWVSPFDNDVKGSGPILGRTYVLLHRGDSDLSIPTIDRVTTEEIESCSHVAYHSPYTNVSFPQTCMSNVDTPIPVAVSLMTEVGKLHKRNEQLNWWDFGCGGARLLMILCNWYGHLDKGIVADLMPRSCGFEVKEVFDSLKCIKWDSEKVKKIDVKTNNQDEEDDGEESSVNSNETDTDAGGDYDSDPEDESEDNDDSDEEDDELDLFAQHNGPADDNPN